MPIQLQTNWGAMGASGRSSERNSGRSMPQPQKKLQLKRAGAVPAVTQLSGGVRIHSSGLLHQINDTEGDVSMMQTVARSLRQVEQELRALQGELQEAQELESWGELRRQIESHLELIDELALATHYGDQNLLDGSRALKGFAAGEHLEFIEAEGSTASSPARGYSVRIDRSATQAELKGFVPLTRELIDHEERLVLREGRSELKFVTRKGESLEQTLQRLMLLMNHAQLPLELVQTPNGVLHFRHAQYGSQPRFSGSSLTPGVLSPEPEAVTESVPGMDVVGSINDEPAHGVGQLLTGSPDSPKTAGIRVRFSGLGDSLGEVGSVTILQNGVPLHIRGAVSSSTRLSLRSIRIHELGTNVPNLSGYTSLAQIAPNSPEQCDDALQVVKKAVREVMQAMDRIKLLNQEQVQISLKRLRQDHAARQETYSVIPDPGTAQSVAQQTRWQIMHDSGKSALAQSNQTPETVMHLLR